MSLEHHPARQARKRGRKPRKVDPATFADRWWDPDETAAFLNVSVQALAQDRVNGRPFGLPYAKFGTRVKYRQSVIESWSQSQVRTPGKGRAA